MELTTKFGQYNQATLYDSLLSNQGVRFRFEYMQNANRRFEQVINNLIVEQGVVTIMTNDNLPFKVNKYVVFKDGSKYLIREYYKVQDELNPQINYWKKGNPNTQYIIALIEIENAEELK